MRYSDPMPSRSRHHCRQEPRKPGRKGMTSALAEVIQGGAEGTRTPDPHTARIRRAPGLGVPALANGSVEVRPRPVLSDALATRLPTFGHDVGRRVLAEL